MYGTRDASITRFQSSTDLKRLVDPDHSSLRLVLAHSFMGALRAGLVEIFMVHTILLLLNCNMDISIYNPKKRERVKENA